VAVLIIGHTLVTGKKEKVGGYVFDDERYQEKPGERHDYFLANRISETSEEPVHIGMRTLMF
jgi:hypothetical protein